MRKCLIFTVTVATFFLFAFNLISSEIHGFIKTTSYMGVRGDEKFKFPLNSVKFQLAIDRELGDRGYLYGGFDIVYEKDNNSEADTRLVPVEFYGEYSADYFTLKCGKYYNFWGNFPWISSVDIINSWDYNHLSSDIEDYRKSTYGLLLSGGINQINLEINLLPVFEGNSLPGTDNFKRELPEHRVSNTEVAIKLNGNFDSIGLDWDGYFYRGFQKQPQILIKNMSVNAGSTMGAGQNFVEPVLYFQKIRLYGADFSYQIFSFLFNFEGSYVETEDKDGTNPFLDNPNYNLIAGIEYSPIQYATVNISYKFTRLLKFNDNIDRNRDYKNNSVSLNINFSPKDYILFQIVSNYIVNDESLFVLPIASYGILDDFTLTVGGVLFYGKNDTIFGKMTEQSRIFAEIKSSF